MLPENNNQINQTSNYLDNILNSTSPITPEILFEAVDKCKKDEQEKLKLLLEKAFEQGINIDILKEPGKYTLLYVSIANNLQDVATFLLEKGGNPNIQNFCSYTPLHYIIKMAEHVKYRIEIVELLIKKCTNLELKDLFDLTFVQEAVIFNNKEATQLLIQYDANIDIKVSNNKSMHHKKNLIELAKTPILKALLKLIKACKDNNFNIVDNTITAKDIAEFIDWQLSITPENSKSFSKHLSELDNLKNFLETRPKLVNSETIQKINEYLISPNIIKYAVNVLINEIENLNRELAGDMLNDWAEKF